MADRIAVSKSTGSIMDNLRYSTRLEYGNLARLALAYSIKKTGGEVNESLDRSGREILRSAIFNDEREELVFRTTIQFVHKRPFDEDQFINYRSVVKDHIDNGCNLLQALFIRCEENPTSFFQTLWEEVDTKAFNDYKGSVTAEFPALNITIGTHHETRQPVVVEINNTKKHANPNLAIAGKAGTGKTQLLLKILADIRVLSHYQTNFIFIDYKGDVFNKGEFLRATRARVFNPLRNPLPINPFVITEYTDKAIKMSAIEKADSFSCIDSKIGTVQRGMLSRAIEEAYRRRSSADLRYPDFPETYAILRRLYEAEGKRDDSLTEVMHHLANFNLFWSHQNEEKLTYKLHQETCIIDLHELPVLKELVAYLIIERLYKEMTVLADSPVINGYRQIRTVLVIDEAHNYLTHKNLFLQKIIREGRSKGIAVFFASQSPGDYVQKSFDFKELLEFMFAFGCDGLTPTQIQEMFGCHSKTSKDLSVELARLTKGHVVTKDFVNNTEYLRFEADAFHLSL